MLSRELRQEGMKNESQRHCFGLGGQKKLFGGRWIRKLAM